LLLLGARYIYPRTVPVVGDGNGMHLGKKEVRVRP